MVIYGNTGRKCRTIAIWCAVLFSNASVPTVSEQVFAQELISFDAWKARCLAVPSNRKLQGRMPTESQLPLPKFAAVHDQARALLRQFQKSELAQSANWIDAAPNESEFFDIDRTYFTRPPIPFSPFAQKLRIPTGSKVIFHGDLHGDIRSLMLTLNWLNQQDHLDGFKIKDPRTFLVFLGDYVDRGSYGIEVVYTLTRLKLANPQQVLMVRGNHEDYQLTTAYGFIREGESKYGRQFNPLSIWRIYDFLPVVVYLGVGENYLQCNHGGMECGYDPKRLLASLGDTRFQLIGEIKQATFARAHPGWLANADDQTRQMAADKLADFRPTSPTQPAPIGFMWNDFFVFEDEPILGFNSSRLAFNHGRASTSYLLESASSEGARLRAVFRAHQHSSVPNPMMNRLLASKGAFRHWQATDSLANAEMEKSMLGTVVEISAKRSIPDGSAWTFNVSPDSVYGGGNEYSFDTIGIVETAESFDNWRLQVINIPVPVD